MLPLPTKYVHIYKEYHSVCPLVGIGSLPTRLCPSPQNRGGGGEAHSPACEGLGESQFQRLEKKLSTRATLCPSPSLWFNSPPLPPPLPCVNETISILHKRTVCKRIVCGGGGYEVCWRPFLQKFYTVLHSVSDQIQNLQNCKTTPNKNLGEEGA
jgi:hypothetical protein